MKDRFQVYQNAAVITPSDTANLNPTAWALFVDTGAGGTAIKVDTIGGSIGVVIPLQASQAFVLPLMVTKVYATGTSLGTGGGCVAMW